MRATEKWKCYWLLQMSHMTYAESASTSAVCWFYVSCNTADYTWLWPESISSCQVFYFDNLFTNVRNEASITLHSFFFFCLFLAAATCLFSLICALVLAFLDKRAEKILHKEQGETGTVFGVVCFFTSVSVTVHSNVWNILRFRWGG